MRDRLIELYGVDALYDAGVIVRTGVKSRLERCPGCDDCDDMPSIHKDSTDHKGYCAYCSKNGEKISLPLSDVMTLEYSEEGLARKFAAAFGIKGHSRKVGEVWHLGKSAKLFGRARRDICLVGMLRTGDENLWKSCPPGIAYLLLAGAIDGGITDSQLQRRVFTFEQLLDADESGKLEVDLEQVDLQLMETEGLAPDKSPKLPAKAEKLASYYCTQAFALLNLKKWDDVMEAMDKLRPATSLAAKIGVSPAQISRNLDVEGKKKPHNEICQFWYDICTKPESFKAFETITQNYQHEHNRPMKNDGALRVFQKIANRLIAASVRK